MDDALTQPLPSTLAPPRKLKVMTSLYECAHKSVLAKTYALIGGFPPTMSLM